MMGVIDGNMERIITTQKLHMKEKKLLLKNLN